MEIQEVSPAQYRQLFPQPGHIYATPEFVALNTPRVERVAHVVGYDGGKPRIGIIAGLRDGVWHSPFTAPFSDVDMSSKWPGIETCIAFFEGLRAFLGAPVRLTLPPRFYIPEKWDFLVSILSNVSKKSYTDYNQHYPLFQAADFERYINSSARWRLHKAMKLPFKVEKTDDIAAVHRVNVINKTSNGYPVNHTLDIVRSTVKPSGPIEADFFLLKYEETDVASAMIYLYPTRLAQLIFWGDIPEYRSQGAMRILAKELVEHYAARGFSIFDFGPSSSQGEISPGLIDFKASLGGILSPKPTYFL